MAEGSRMKYHVDLLISKSLVSYIWALGIISIIV